MQDFKKSLRKYNKADKIQKWIEDQRRGERSVEREKSFEVKIELKLVSKHSYWMIHWYSSVLEVSRIITMSLDHTCTKETTKTTLKLSYGVLKNSIKAKWTFSKAKLTFEGPIY